MAMFAVQLANADRMMTHAEARGTGIELLFADGCRGLVPFSDIPEIGSLANLEKIELPNAYEIVLRNRRGETVQLPWDFGRHYCDPAYRPRVEALARVGRHALGQRIRQLREASHLTQEKLAGSARIGRVTLVRIEKGEQSPKYDTLVALASAMNRDPGELFQPPR
jgi:DNA-binding XRE family transcriptional regulator